MTGLRKRLVFPIGLATDLTLAGALGALWLTHGAGASLRIAYLAIAVGAVVRSGGRGVAVRTVLTAATAFTVSAVHGLTAVSEVAFLSALGLLFAAAAVRRDRAFATAERDRSRLAGLIGALPLATIAFDGQARIMTWNPAAEQLFGWRAEEVVGARNPIVSPDARAGSDEIYRRILAGEFMKDTEVERTARDGTKLDLAIHSAPLSPSAGADGGFLVLYADIRERKRAQRESDAAQRRYRELIEAMPLVTYIDEVDASATNVYTSPQVTDLLGWTPADLLSDANFFEQMLHPDDRDRVMAHLAECNESRLPFRAEYRLRHLDGRHVWVRDHSSIVEDETRDPFARGFLLDITEQKQLEEQLLQSRKMEALGQFAGGIAHDFNNLLTAINGYAELASRAAPGDGARRCLDGIRTAAGEAASLTAGLLAFSRRDVPERRVLDLNEVVRGANDLLVRLVREDVAIQLDLAEQPPLVAADLSQLKQVILNLALNGRDAMGEGGALTIHTSRQADSVVLRVQDTGCGMTAETRSRAYEPFYTTKAEGEGTGLGLAVVYGVVDALGGTLSIESRVGEGTTVEIRLPAASGPLEAGRHAEAADAPVRGSERVLVVEDREILLQLARSVLEEAGFDVVASQSGVEALALAEREPPFDLLLSDVIMPDMNGPELARRLRERQRGLPVLFMSGYTDDVLDAAELAAPGTGFLRKPFGTAALVAKVREMLDEPAFLAA